MSADERAAERPRERPGGAPGQRDYTALVILAVLSLLEVALLYLLIAVDTPLTPIVWRLLRNPPGVFTLVMFVVTLLCYGMVLVLSLLERRRRATDREPLA